MVIKNAKMVDKNGIKTKDFIVEDKDKKIIDAKGAFLLPGLIDLNVKFYDDIVSSENIKRLSKKALKGGVTKVVLNPDLNPAIDNEISLEFIKSESKNSNIEIVPLIKATKESDKLSEIAILLKKGANSIFFYSYINSFLICRIFEYAKMYNVVLHCRATNLDIKNVGVMHEGEISSRLGLGGINEIEEVSEVAKIIEFAKHYDVEVLFKSLSSAKSIELIKRAKDEGIRVYSEVSIHHLLKTDKECEGYNTKAKLDPPLRDEKNREKLIEFLKNDDIDILTSLHSPKSTLQKDISFDDAAFGVDAIESFLQDIYENLVKKDIISFYDALKLTYFNPLKILKQNSQSYKDLILFDGKGVERLV